MARREGLARSWHLRPDSIQGRFVPGIRPIPCPPQAMPDELSTDEALRVLGETAEVNLETMLILSGGDPLLAELPETIRSSRDVGARVLMVFFLVCSGRGQDLVDLTPEEYERALGFLVKAQGNEVMIRSRCAPTFRRVLAQTTPDSILLTGA